MGEIPTIKVKSDHPDHVQGFYIINAEDFDPDKHEFWEPKPLAKKEDAPQSIDHRRNKA
jgi:hypothetical protein